jgi:hypothetical protein
VTDWSLPQSSKKTRRWAPRGSGPTRPCPSCGTPFYVTPFKTVKNKVNFCSKVCYLKARGAALDPVESFWMKVEKRGPEECWGWKAQKRWDGYGRFVHKRKPIWAHRFSYELHHGAIQKGMHVLHSCDNPACTNPKHLSLGSHQENMAECKARGRTTAGERSYHAKLTEEQARWIKANYRKTGPRRGNGSAIAKRFGVTPGVVHAIGIGRTWKHL